MIPPLQSCADEHTIVLARKTTEDNGVLSISWCANIIHNDTTVATVALNPSIEHVIGQAVGAAVVCAAKRIGVEGLACHDSPAM
jgi:hypothetical protein